jgi:hypothetical protein
MNTEVEDASFPTLFRITVPEINATFLRGLGTFKLKLTRMRPTKDGRIKISMLEDES